MSFDLSKFWIYGGFSDFNSPSFEALVIAWAAQNILTLHLWEGHSLDRGWMAVEFVWSMIFKVWIYLDQRKLLVISSWGDQNHITVGQSIYWVNSEIMGMLEGMHNC
jgi:hypothetical protein